MRSRGRRLMTAVLAMLIAVLPLVPGPAAPVGNAKGEDVCPEPNDDFQAACFLGPGSDALGFISNPDDLDAYRFESFAFNAKAHVEIADQPVPYQFVVANWNGDPIANSTTDGSIEKADITLPMPGSYYVFVQSRTGEFSDTTPYRVLTRVEYATQPAPTAIYRGDFRAGGDDNASNQSTVDYVRSDGKLTITNKETGSRAEARTNTWWLGSNTSEFILVVDARVISGTDGGFAIRFGGQEPVIGPTHDQMYVVVDPGRKQVALAEYDGTTFNSRSPWTSAATLRSDGRVNRTAISVAGGQVRINVNGAQVLVWEGQVKPGRFAVGTFNWGTDLSVSFDNVLATVPTVRPAAGAVLLSENFDDPVKALVATSSPAPDRYTLAYEGGEYAIRTTPTATTRGASAILPFQYEDITVAVDGRVTDATPTSYIQTVCRAAPGTNGSFTGYIASVFPVAGRVRLVRLDGDQNSARLAETNSPAVKGGSEMNRLAMTCRGPTILVSVNGTQVIGAEDSTYSRGNVWFGVGDFREGPPPVEGRFDNLVITQQ